MHMHNSTTHRARQVHGRVPVLHIRGTPRRSDRSSQNTTCRANGNANNLPIAPNRAVHAHPSHNKSSPNKRLNPLAAEYVPTIYVAPAASDPGWVDFRNPSPSLSRGSTLNPIEEEPDLIFDDVTDVSFVEDRLPPDVPQRDEMTGGLIDTHARRVYSVATLLSHRSDSACRPQPDTLAVELRLTTKPFHSIVEAIVQAMDKPIVFPERRRYPRPRFPHKPVRLPARPPKRPIVVPRTELEKLMRKTTAILNRIAPDKFDRLSTRLFELIQEQVKCEPHLEAVLEAVVNTAVMQPAFVQRYVQLIGVVSGRQEIVDSWEWAHEAHVKSDKIVRHILLKICRRLHELYWFESHPDPRQDFLSYFGREYWQMQIDKDVLNTITSFCSTTDDETAAKLKSKFFGIEIVMAEMFNQKLMPKRALCVKVINPLLRCQLKNVVDAESAWRNRKCSVVELEAACKLLTVCGATLDHSGATRWVDTYFDIICDRAQDFESRAKFMAMDLCDLRGADWNARSDDAEMEERILLAGQSAHRRS